MTKLEEKRLERIGSAAAGIAHDMNNELTLILNYLAAEDLAGAREATARCSGLTSSLLSYSRGEALCLLPVDLVDFLRMFARQMRVPPGVRVAVLTEAPAEARAEIRAEVRMDTASVARALTNLVRNACDAMDGAGELRIEASGRCIVVTDSGPGIAARDLPRVFRPFFTTKGAKGTGLGLAIVRDIMQRHGGSVTAASREGSGASFILRFR